MKKTLLAATLLLLVSALPARAQAIDTTPQWNGTQFVSSFGVPNTATYGQTIVLPAPNVLNGWNFRVGNCGAQVDFRASVFAWDTVNSRATGASLFQTGVLSVPAGAAFTTVSINTGNLNLPAGTYVIFFSTSQDQTVNVACRFGATPDTAYVPGTFVFINNGTVTAQWTGNAWSTNFGIDLAMQVFLQQPVPAMPVWMLALLAVILLGGSSLMLRGRFRTA